MHNNKSSLLGLREKEWVRVFTLPDVKSNYQYPQHSRHLSHSNISILKTTALFFSGKYSFNVLLLSLQSALYSCPCRTSRFLEAAATTRTMTLAYNTTNHEISCHSACQMPCPHPKWKDLNAGGLDVAVVQQTSSQLSVHFSELISVFKFQCMHFGVVCNVVC